MKRDKQQNGKDKTMYKTTVLDCDNKITVDITGLQAMLSIGKNTAAEKEIEKLTGRKADRRRKLYNVQKIQQYINSMGA